MSRRRLPAPPLVLQPVFRRVPVGSAMATQLLDLATFLQQRGLLTDGGSLNLAQGFRGKGGVVSLTTQDVRASAHGLTRDLLKTPDRCKWPALTDDYYSQYDRGKPRRPNRLQRLFVAWSADLGPLGLLEAAQTHPHLWELIRCALQGMSSSDLEASLLALALSVYDSQDWSVWKQQFESPGRDPQNLLGLLPLLPYPCIEERLDWLAAEASSDHPLEVREALLLACRRPTGSCLVAMPESLISLTLSVTASAPARVDPRWLGILRQYRWPSSQLEQLADLIETSDPVHRIVYGPRPGRHWLSELWNELLNNAD